MRRNIILLCVASLIAGSLLLSACKCKNCNPDGKPYPTLSAEDHLIMERRAKETQTPLGE